MNTRIMFIVCLVAVACLSCGRSKESRFRIIQDNRTGFIDKSGRIAIPPRFHAAMDFSEGLAIVDKDGNDGRYDPELEVVENPGNLGYIDTTGEVVIPFQFDCVGNFHEGLAQIKLGDKWGFIDTAGNTAIEPQFESAWRFSDGLALIKMEGKYGFINRKGELTINPRFDFARGFSEGLAAVHNGEKFGFIDLHGVMSIQPHYDQVSNFKCGMACVVIDERVGFIDNSGKLAIKCRFEGAGLFSEGLAAVRIGEKWGFIDQTGQITIAPQYEEVSSFSDGLAAIKRDGRFGFIDRKGKMVICPQFNDVQQFENGLAWVKLYKSSGYIDKTGKYIWRDGNPLIPPTLPKELLGIWYQQDPPAQTRLRFGQVDGVPTVSLCLESFRIEPAEAEWFGPLESTPLRDGAWQFLIVPVVHQEGANVTRTFPPEITLSRQYIRDQYGRILIHSCEALRKDGPVTVRPEKDGLLVKGLWVQVEFTSWDNKGKPIEQKITPRSTKFTRASHPLETQ